MRYLGLLIYLSYRLIARVWNPIVGFILASFLVGRAKCCRSVKISGFGRFMCVHGLEIGKNVGINAGAYWVCEGGLTIGDNCRFARNVTIYTRNHNYKGALLPYDHSNVARPVTIGRNVWVGVNVTILPGTKINDGAIIGAGAVVYGEIPRGAIVGSAGFKVKGYRDEAHYLRLDQAGAYVDLK